MTTTTIRNSVKCPRCAKKFDTRGALSTHLRMIHQIAGANVAVKPKNLAKPSSFLQPTIKCPHCPLMFRRKTGLGSHMRTIHGIAGTGKSTLGYHRNKAKPSPATPVQGTLPTLESSEQESIVPAHSVDLHDREPLASEANMSVPTCPDCKQTFPNNATLGRHRRFKHGILGKAAVKAKEEAEAAAAEAPKRRGRPLGSKTNSNATQLQTIERASPHVQKFDNGNEDHATLNPLAYAVAVGSIQEFCRHFAEEHDIPTRQFTRQCAELFLRQTRR